MLSRLEFIDQASASHAVLIALTLQSDTLTPADGWSRKKLSAEDWGEQT
jgi:hypothetical protein